MRGFAPVSKFFEGRSDEDASHPRSGRILCRFFRNHRAVSNFNKVISPSRLLLVEANSGI